MTPSHRRNRVKVAGRWVLPGAVVILRSAGVPAFTHGFLATTPPTGALLVVARAHDSDFARFISPVTGETITLNRKHLSALSAEIVSLGPPA